LHSFLEVLLDGLQLVIFVLEFGKKLPIVDLQICVLVLHLKQGVTSLIHLKLELLYELLCALQLCLLDSHFLALLGKLFLKLDQLVLNLLVFISDGAGL